MSRTSRFFFRTVPTAFVAGTLFGVSIATIGAAFKGSAVFRDIPTGHYADDAIGEMYQLGIIKGLNSSQFGPDDPITRGQVAILMQRLRNELKGITSSVSSRSSVSSSSSSSSVASSSSSSSSSSQAYNAGGYVRFDSNGYNVDKNIAVGNLSIAIVRIGGNQGAGTVEYTMTGGTAEAGKDYTLTKGTLTFGSKETSKKITIPIINNTSVSGTRTVNLVLKNPTGVLKIGDPTSVTVNINDPNAPSSSGTASSSSAQTSAVVSLSATAYAVNENAGTISINAVRSGVLSTPVSVSYATNAGSAYAGSDFSPVSGTLSFAANETVKNFTVSISDNNAIEGSRSFTAVLSNPTDGATLGVNSAPVTINDNESVQYTNSGSVKFSLSTYTVSESSGKAVITVTHVGGMKPFAVNYTVNNGSALSGSDFTTTSGTLNFAQGEVSKVFEIPIMNDGVTEEEETAFMSLSAPTQGVTLGDPSTATLRISN